MMIVHFLLFIPVIKRKIELCLDGQKEYFKRSFAFVVPVTENTALMITL